MIMQVVYLSHIVDWSVNLNKAAAQVTTQSQELVHF